MAQEKKKKKKSSLFSRVKSRAKRGIQERRIKKAYRKGTKISYLRKPSEKKKAGGQAKTIKEALKDSSPTGKIRKGAKEIQLTKGGAYAKYGKKSKAAGAFRKAFSDGCKGGKPSFTWDGRLYSCAKKKTKKAAPKAAAKKVTSKLTSKSRPHKSPFYKGDA